MSEIGYRKSEDEKTEIRGQKSEVTPVECALLSFGIQLGKNAGERKDRDQRSEVGGQKSEVGSRRTKRQRSEITPVEHPGREPGSTGQGSRMSENEKTEIRDQKSEVTPVECALLSIGI